MKKLNNFIEYSEDGRCFLCKSETFANFPAVKVEPGHFTSPFPTYSLRCLSRYLNLEFGNVLDKNSYIHSFLNCKTELTVQLCAECTSLNDKFSEVYRQLEKSEMEVAYYSDLIRMKLNNPNVAGTCQENSSRILLGNRIILEELRMKMKQKYHNKITLTPPRIKLRKLRHGKFENHEAKHKSANIGNHIITDENPDISNCSVDADIELGDVKILGMIDDGIAHPKIQKVWKPHNSGRQGRRNFRFSKTHQCSRCFKRFTSDYYLQDHVNSVHLHISRKCRICSKEFKYRQSFNLHNRKFHGRYQGSRNPSAAAILVQRPGPAPETRGGNNSNRKIIDRQTKEEVISKIVSIKREPKPQKSRKVAGRGPKPQKSRKVTGRYVTGATIIEPVNSTATGEPQCILNPESGKFKCKDCPKEYMEERSFQDHYDTVHRKIRFCCNICSKILCTRQSFSVHYRSEHQGLRFKCLDCLETFPLRSSLWNHQRKNVCGAIQNPPIISGLSTAHRCHKCPRTFPNVDKLMEHELLHEKDEEENEHSWDNVSSTGDDKEGDDASDCDNPDDVA